MAVIGDLLTLDLLFKEVLNEHGFLVWIEPSNVLTSNNMDEYLNRTLEHGIFAWPSKEPVTQLTHPTMFKYLKAKQEDFYFVHMIDTTVMLILNKPKIHYDLMLPWIKCALREDCLSPPGAQLSGCEFDRRPEFLYSGCHRYESSSFSIISTLLFEFNSSTYVADENTGKSAFVTSIANFFQSNTTNLNLVKITEKF